ncbi:hypothetical protein A3848_06300 [Paenibacillus sp. P32E]|nr:hypothetical protein A3848_06300 [Paenibacillus sp. P32E]
MNGISKSLLLSFGLKEGFFVAAEQAVSDNIPGSFGDTIYILGEGVVNLTASNPHCSRTMWTAGVYMAVIYHKCKERECGVSAYLCLKRQG